MFISPQYKTGTVPSFAGVNNTGLLQTLVTWVTSNSGTPGLDWQILHEEESTDNDLETSSYGSGYKEYILYNTGESGNENIYIGFREYKYESENEYGWELNGYLSQPDYWNSNYLISHNADGWDSDRKHWTELPVLQLFDNEMAYWFYSTTEFIFVGVRVSTNYYQCYLGNIVRYGSPANYPYPLYIGGSAVGNKSYQSGGNGPVRPSTQDPFGTCFVWGPDGVVYKGSNLWVYPMEGISDNTSYSGTTTSKSLLLPVVPLISVGEVDQTLGQLFNVVVYRNTNALSEMTYTDEDYHKFRVFAQGQTDYDYDFLGVYEIMGTTTTTTTTTTT